MAKTVETSPERMKRELIYVGERLQEINRESAALFTEKDGFDGARALSEPEKRRSIYVTERLLRLQAERSELIGIRDALMAAL